MIEAAVFGCEHYDNVGERNWTEDCIDIIAKWISGMEIAEGVQNTLQLQQLSVFLSLSYVFQNNWFKIFIINYALYMMSLDIIMG